MTHFGRHIVPSFACVSHATRSLADQISMIPFALQERASTAVSARIPKRKVALVRDDRALSAAQRPIPPAPSELKFP
jgi:hypothetical protein